MRGNGYESLRPDGSFVFELGGAWNTGSGTRSLYPYELVLRLTRLFHLAQEFYWYNPSRLPTPAEWVTIRRTRVKDAVNTLWWLSKTETPQADNRRVLRPYSRSMKRLLRDGYQPAKRPSQHEIGPHFQRDNGGAIPPNILTVPNTRSYDLYIRRCKAAGLPVHPARFPAEIPDFFIRFLTSERQLVLDPFAGSGSTLVVAKKLGRHWIGFELSKRYANKAQNRLDTTREGDPLVGAEDPKSSVPATADGKKLIRVTSVFPEMTTKARVRRRGCV